MTPATTLLLLVLLVIFLWSRPKPVTPPPKPARTPTVTVARCPCGNGYWVNRSNGPSGHYTGSVPEGEALERIMSTNR